MNARTTPGVAAANAAAPVPSSSREAAASGVVVFGADLKLQHRSARLGPLREHPTELLAVGTPLEDWVLFEALRGDYGSGDSRARVQERLARLLGAEPTVHEHVLADGRVVVSRCDPLAPSGLALCYEEVSAAGGGGHPPHSVESYGAAEVTRLARELQARNRDLHEALEQQAATVAVLETLGRSTFALQPVLETLITNAVRLCEAESGVVYRFDGRLLRLEAAFNISPEFKEFVEANPLEQSRGTAAGRAALERHTVHIADVAADPDYRYPAAYTVGTIRSILGVPMVKEGAAIGVMTIWRSEVRPFTERQIDLLTAFADEAAIAIENVRLLRELQARNRALTEALEQQTATAEILRVISRSPTDVGPVFDTIAEAALALCAGQSCNVLTFDGTLLHAAALATVNAQGREAIRSLYPRSPDPGVVAGRVILSRAAVTVADVLEDPQFSARDAALKADFRSILGVPLMREGSPIGAIVVGRRQAGPFPEQQVALLQTFADQAVIAIENVRLFKELEARNREVSAALEQQTATSEILRVISRSPTDVQPVFDAIAAAALALCRATSANVLTYDGGMLRLAARAMTRREGLEAAQAIFPRRATSDTAAGRAVLTRRLAMIADVFEDPDYAARHVAAVSGTRGFLAVPLLREGTPIGAIAVGRPEPGAIPDQQVALLQTFADQAVIAIENVRLFNELREKGAQLELASRHKSQFLANMSHELRTPLNAIIGFTRIVLRRARDQLEPKQAENLEKILASGNHLLALINAILDLSKIEAGHVQVNAIEIELAPVLEHCLLTIEPLVKADAVDLLADFGGAPPRMLVDEEKLRQIVINLLSNAAKFTVQGSIRLHVEARDDTVSVAVADTGIGIADEKLDVIFEEFEQADASSTREFAGTGLGLAIARRLARLMGGDIAAASVPGRGSTFTLTLPRRYRPTSLP